MKPSVSELHAAHPFNPDEKYWYGSVGFNEAAAMADNVYLQDDPVRYLDDLLTNDYPQASAIRDSLLFLPPKVLINELGSDIAAWTSVSTAVSGMNDELNEELEHAAGYKMDDLEVARSWEWRQHMRILGKPILAQYDLMQHMRSDLLQEVDLPKLLHTSAKQDVTISDSRIKDYELIPLEADPYNTYYSGGRVKDWSGDKTETLAYHLWLDAPTGFALTYKGMPNAMGGVAMYGTDELTMYQLQGVQGKRIDPSKSEHAKDRFTGIVKARGLAPFDWQKLMVGVTEQLAGAIGLGSVSLQSGKNNVWTQKRMPNDTEPHLPIETAKKIYDETAIRLGYTKQTGDTRGNWHKPVVR